MDREPLRAGIFRSVTRCTPSVDRLLVYWGEIDVLAVEPLITLPIDEDTDVRMAAHDALVKLAMPIP